MEDKTLTIVDFYGIILYSNDILKIREVKKLKQNLSEVYGNVIRFKSYI